MAIKVNKNFLEAVESGLSFKKLPDLKALKKSLKALPNRPDIGNTQMAEYSPLEKRVQLAENIDSVVSNVGFLAETKPVLKALSKLGTVGAVGGKALTVAGRLAAPVQAALWQLDAVRTMAEPKYRAEAEKAVDRTLENTDPNQSFNIPIAVSALARPTSTVQGLLDNLSQSDTDIINQQLKQDSQDRQLLRLRRERSTILGRRSESKGDREVPLPDIREGTQPNARKFFK
jgi:hypothetical protein